MSISTQPEELQKKKTKLRPRREGLSLLSSKSLTVWILGFFTFALALTTFHALLLQTQYGPTATFETHLLSPFTGPIQVATYFWASLILTCTLFGATSFAAFRYSFELDTLMKLSSVLNHNTKQLAALLDIKIDNLRQEIEAEINELTSTVTNTKRKLKALEKRAGRPKRAG